MTKSTTHPQGGGDGEKVSVRRGDSHRQIVHQIQKVSSPVTTRNYLVRGISDVCYTYCIFLETAVEQGSIIIVLSL